MSRIYWDTMLFVYWLEDNAQFGGRVAQILLSMQEREDVLLTSAFGVGELLVAPTKAEDLALTSRIEEIFKAPFVEVIPFDLAAAVRYAEIRAKYRFSPADAVHLACAAQAKADLFLTNDKKLIGKHVPGIQFVAGLDVNLF
ncbi:MAG: PilT protein [Acidobacteriales bacterium]|nr:PilT protein [Terriglobales bacterium]